jgi:hypothetical protein
MITLLNRKLLKIFSAYHDFQSKNVKPGVTSGLEPNE